MGVDLLEVDKLSTRLASIDSSGLVLIRDIATLRSVDTVLQRLQIKLELPPRDLVSAEYIEKNSLQFIEMHQPNPLRLVWTKDKVKQGPQLMLLNTATSNLTLITNPFENAEVSETPLASSSLLKGSVPLLLDSLTLCLAIWSEHEFN